MADDHKLIWFSNFGTEYAVEVIGDKKVVMFTGVEEIFDWDNCSIQLGPSPSKKIRPRK